MFLGKVRIIIQRCHVKKNLNELQVSGRKSLAKKSLLLQLRIPHQSTVRPDSITNYFKNVFSSMLQAQIVLTFKLPEVFEEYIPLIPPSCADQFCLLFPLLTGVICFKHTSVFGLLKTVCNPKCTVRVFVHKETAIYYK